MGTITYISNYCNENKDVYKSNQSYVDHLIAITKWCNNIGNIDYTDASLSRIVNAFSGPFNLLLVETVYNTKEKQSGFYSNLIASIDLTTNEYSKRERYDDECVCVGNAGHTRRTNLIKQLSSVLHKTLDEAAEQLCMIKDLPIIDKSFFQLSYPKGHIGNSKNILGYYHIACLLGKREELYGIESSVYKAIENITSPLLVSYFASQIKSTPFPWSSDVDSRLALQEIFRGFYDLYKPYLIETIKTHVEGLIVKNVLQVSTFGNNVSCVEYNPNTEPIKVYIDYKALAAYLLPLTNISFGPDALSRYVERNIQGSTYRSCFTSMSQPSLTYLCKLIDKLQMDPTVRDELTKMCPNYTGLVGSLLNNTSTNTTIRGVWRRNIDSTALLVLKDGRKPTGSLVDDLPYLTQSLAFDLLQQFMEENRSRKSKRKHAALN